MLELSTGKSYVVRFQEIVVWSPTTDKKVRQRWPKPYMANGELFVITNINRFDPSVSGYYLSLPGIPARISPKFLREVESNNTISLEQLNAGF